MIESHIFMELPVAGKILRLTLKHWKGNDIADLRLFYHDNGELKATKQGIQTNRETWREIAAYLDEYLRDAE
jgi:hypothetical protein